MRFAKWFTVSLLLVSIAFPIFSVDKDVWGQYYTTTSMRGRVSTKTVPATTTILSGTWIHTQTVTIWSCSARLCELAYTNAPINSRLFWFSIRLVYLSQPGDQFTYQVRSPTSGIIWQKTTADLSVEGTVNIQGGRVELWVSMPDPSNLVMVEIVGKFGSGSVVTRATSYSSLIYWTEYQTLRMSSTGVTQNPATIPVQGQFSAFSTNLGYLLIVFILVVFVALAIYRSGRFTAKKRGRPSRFLGRTQEKTGLYCINCGVGLRHGARFCDKCGSTQE